MLAGHSRVHLLVLNCLSFKASLIIFDSCLYNILRYLQSLHALGPKPEKSSWECRIVEGIRHRIQGHCFTLIR